MKIVNALRFLLLPLSLCLSLSPSPSLFISFPPPSSPPYSLAHSFFLTLFWVPAPSVFPHIFKHFHTPDRHLYFYTSPLPSCFSLITLSFSPHLNKCTHIHAFLTVRQTLNHLCSVSHYPKNSVYRLVPDNLNVYFYYYFFFY